MDTMEWFSKSGTFHFRSLEGENKGFSQEEGAEPEEPRGKVEGIIDIHFPDFASSVT